jgi:hypothetical protein
MFENVDTAKADAQIVRILDTLDKNMFELSSFEFGNVAVGDKIFNVPKGRQQFVVERDLTPQKNMKLRINASLDTATGVVEWQFTSIDPVTGDLPDFFGFLPPNVQHPDGEGSVSYTIRPKAGLAHGTVIRSKAAIIFDDNKPISTNTWQNTIDAIAPGSTLTSRLQNDTVITIVYNGNDVGSGIDYRHLYISQDDGPWLSMGGSSGDTVVIHGELGHQYKFFVKVQDKVGNIENKAAIEEAVVLLPQTLAITLGDISASNEGNRNRVTWNTLLEDKGDRFEVEKSIDGRNFTKLTSLPARGFASSYTVFDDQPVEGRNYYRLKTHDVAGSKLSKTVSAVVLKNNEFAINAFPNPVKNQLNINIHGTIARGAGISISNAMGSVVKQYNITSNRVVINFTNYPAGTYLIKYTDNNRSEVIKIIKQ